MFFSVSKLTWCKPGWVSCLPLLFLCLSKTPLRSRQRPGLPHVRPTLGRRSLNMISASPAATYRKPFCIVFPPWFEVTEYHRVPCMHRFFLPLKLDVKLIKCLDLQRRKSCSCLFLRMRTMSYTTQVTQGRSS